MASKKSGGCLPVLLLFVVTIVVAFFLLMSNGLNFKTLFVFGPGSILIILSIFIKTIIVRQIKL